MADWESHPEYLALLEAVLTNPKDDAPRGIMSDWLEDHDEIRFAQFIRSQLELNQLIIANTTIKTTYIENARLINLHRSIGELWTSTPYKNEVRALFYQMMSKFGNWLLLLDFLTGVSFEAKALVHRGFVSEISLPCALFMKHAAGLFREQPITAVWLTDKEPLGSPNDRIFQWFAASQTRGLDCNRLPEELFSRLSGRDLTLGIGYKSKATETEAIRSLSDACVAYGRELAGLPMLN